MLIERRIKKQTSVDRIIMESVQSMNEQQGAATTNKSAETDTLINTANNQQGDETVKDASKENIAMDQTSTFTETTVETNEPAKNSGDKEDINDSAVDNESLTKMDDAMDTTSDENANDKSGNESQEDSTAVGPNVQKQDANDENERAEVDAMDEDEDYVKDEEPRRTKRRRSSVTFSRYSPGEGGGLKRHKADSTPADKASPDAVVSQVSVKSKETKDKNESKKRDKKKPVKSDPSDPKSTRQYPIYTWSTTGTPATTKTIHQSLTIDFGPLSSEDHAISPDGSWKCLKCHHTNLSSKSRCSVCLSWKGGKRENYSRKGSEGTTHSTTSSSGASTSKMLIQVGDDVLVSSGDTPWKDLNRYVARAEILERDAETDNGEVSICYDDPVSNEPGLAALDPYVARVVGMWEEIEETSSIEGKSSGSRESKMMIQTRWYFKKEDMEGIALTMDGQEIKDGIVGDMSVRDVILSDQTDSNSVSCILGKASVTCLNPESKAKIKGGFVCRYKMKLDEDEANGSLSPILEEVSQRGSDAASSEDETYSSRTDVFSSSAYGAPLSPRRVISEGPTVGKIKVGPEYQAVISGQVSVHYVS